MPGAAVTGFLLFLKHMNSMAAKTRTAAAAPTPMPAAAPMLSPEDGVLSAHAVCEVVAVADGDDDDDYDSDDEVGGAVVVASVVVASALTTVPLEVAVEVDDELGENVVEETASLLTSNPSPLNASSLFPESVSLKWHLVGN
ncbi:hypothetical protein LQW54_012381 [Pestalotiopsis sp. IQ-011]